MPLRIIHARISNNLNKQFMYSVGVVLFSKTLSYLIFTRLHSRQIIVLVSGLPEFAEQSRLICRVSVDFGSRLLSMVPLLKSFHNVAIFGHRGKKRFFFFKYKNTKKWSDSMKKKNDSMCEKTVER